jgi:mono/diheme cytochrome c family protein
LSNYDESEMPPFGEKLTKAQINALATYLASLR